MNAAGGGVLQFGALDEQSSRCMEMYQVGYPLVYPTEMCGSLPRALPLEATGRRRRTERKVPPTSTGWRSREDTGSDVRMSGIYNKVGVRLGLLFKAGDQK